MTIFFDIRIFGNAHLIYSLKRQSNREYTWTKRPNKDRRPWICCYTLNGFHFHRASRNQHKCRNPLSWCSSCPKHSFRPFSKNQRHHKDNSLVFSISSPYAQRTYSNFDLFLFLTSCIYTLDIREKTLHRPLSLYMMQFTYENLYIALNRK